MKKLKLLMIGWSNSMHLQRFSKWFRDRGHEVIIITDRSSCLDGIKEYDLSARDFRHGRLNRYLRLEFNFHLPWLDYIRKILKVRQIIKEVCPDVVHLHTLYFPSQLGVFSGFKPLIVMPWNGDIIWEGKASLFKNWLVKKALTIADAIPVQTNYLKKGCIKKGADENKIKFIQFGVDIENFLPSGKTDLFDKQVLNTKNVVISTRNIGYNIETLVRAIPLVTSKIPDAKFIFTWPNSEEESKNIRSLVDKLGIKDAVSLIGRVPDHTDVAKCLSISRVFVSISKIDCFPQTALEAMAMKVFPILGDIPPVRDYVENNVKCLLADVNDVSSVAENIIEALKMDEKKRQLAVEENYSYIVQNANFNKEMEKMEELYYNVSQSAHEADHH